MSVLSRIDVDLFKVTRWLALLTGLLAIHGPAGAVTSQPSQVASAAVQQNKAHKKTPFHFQGLSSKAMEYFTAAWGVDKLQVRYTASGNLIRFTYRVSDSELAKPLANKEATPYMVSEKSKAVLRIPQMDKVGTLRQTAPPEAGQEYWMVFSNKGNLVKRGDRVSVVIGPFHADGLVVE